MPKVSNFIKFFRLIAEFLLKTLLDPANRNLLYINNLLIRSQIYIQNFIKSEKRKFVIKICIKDIKFAKLLVSLSAIFNLEQKAIFFL